MRRKESHNYTIQIANVQFKSFYFSVEIKIFRLCLQRQRVFVLYHEFDVTAKTVDFSTNEKESHRIVIDVIQFRAKKTM